MSISLTKEMRGNEGENIQNREEGKKEKVRFCFVFIINNLIKEKIIITHSSERKPKKKITSDESLKMPIYILSLLTSVVISHMMAKDI